LSKKMRRAPFAEQARTTFFMIRGHCSCHTRRSYFRPARR
jgi:hypothetical protein